jgi:NTE family protein
MGSTGLVLGAGGVAGQAFHLALLRAMDEVRGWRGRDADVVVGTSVGALVGFLVRAGASVDELLREATGGELSSPRDLLGEVGHAPTPPRDRLRLAPTHVPLLELTERVRRGPRVPTRTLVGCLLPRGRCGVEPHTAWVDEVADGNWPDARFWVCATDLGDLQRVVWSRSAAGRPPIGTAVAASCAVPGLVRPIVHADREYVDGGLYSPTNADVLVGQGLEEVVVSSPMSAAAGSRSFRPDRWWREVHARTLRREVEALRADGVRVLVVEPHEAELRALWTAGWDGGRGTGRAIDALAASLGRRLEGGGEEPPLAQSA